MSGVGKAWGKNKIELRCARCRRKFQTTAKVILDGGMATCPHCGANYRTDGSAGKEMDRELAKLRRSLEQISRRGPVKIKLKP